MNLDGRFTAKHLHVLRHSLGLDGKNKREYRNHFVAGGEDVQLCHDLVAMGFMSEHPATDISGGDPWFHVTDDGRTIARSAHGDKDRA